MDNKIYRWKNIETNSDVADFEPFTLEDYNEQFGTEYKSVEEATRANPELLWSITEIERGFERCEYKIL